MILRLFVVLLILLTFGCATNMTTAEAPQAPRSTYRVVHIPQSPDTQRSVRLPWEYAPVCNYGGKTYFNAKEAKAERSPIKHEGECTIEDFIPAGTRLSPRLRSQLMSILAEDAGREYGGTMVCFKDVDCLQTEWCDKTSSPIGNHSAADGICNSQH